MFGVAFALLSGLAGLAIVRALRLEHERLAVTLAPAVGLASLAALTTWTGALGGSPMVASVVVLVLCLVGAVVGASLLQQHWVALRQGGREAVVLGGAVLVTAVVLGLTVGRLDVPISNHDGVFHVETIHALRNGQFSESWYPLGFHRVVAAMVGWMAWLDSARATSEAGIGLALLAPLGVYGLGLALGLRPIVSAVAAAVLALTFMYPYDFQVWGGWPLGLSVLLLLALWSVAMRWIQQPSMRWASLAGVLAGGIVVTHGTEVYSAVVGLLVIAVARLRFASLRLLPVHGVLALVVACAAAAPYLETLLGWAAGGGATGAGIRELELAAQFPRPDRPPGWLEYFVGATGGASLVDALLRLALMAIGARQLGARLVVWLWAVFFVLGVLIDLVRVPLVESIYAATFPWLADHRPWQLAVIMASLLCALGLVAVLRSVWSWRRRLENALAARRVAIACVVLVGFLAEGSAVSVYKRLSNDIAQNYLYSTDDDAAMQWLRQYAAPDDVLVNDTTTDAGIWAPYKANVSILLPRSAAGDALQARVPILENLTDLERSPLAEAQACALNVNYVYRGARDHPYDARMLPSRSQLEQTPDLQPVFRSGDAVVYRLQRPCMAASHR